MAAQGSGGFMAHDSTREGTAKEPLLIAAAAIKSSSIATQCGLAEALEELSTKATPPRDLTSWLCGRINASRPEKVLEYPDAVLKGLVMKSDEFANIHILASERPHPAVWNFRRTETDKLPIFGAGQCHLEGMLFLARHLKELGFLRVLWFNMREEPVVFLDGQACAPRSSTNLNENVDHLTSIEGWELDAMESRLRVDCVDAAERDGGYLSIFFQDEHGENVQRPVPVLLDTSYSVRKAYEWLNRQEGAAQVRYIRVPIADETAPEEQDFDKIIRELREIALVQKTENMKTIGQQSGDSVALVFNCQMGRGRTTTGMVCGSILLLAARGWKPPAHAETLPEPNAEGRRRLLGEFKKILELLRLVDSASQSAHAATAGVPKEGRGWRAKLLADQCCNDCAHTQNMVQAIVQCNDSAKSAEPGSARSPEFWARRAINYLERYAYILLFAAYALEEVHGGFDTSFTEWSHEHWQFKRVIKNLTLE